MLLFQAALDRRLVDLPLFKETSMNDSSFPPGSAQERWARLQFAVIGPLLSAPPTQGDLKAELEALSRRDFTHPTREGHRIRFAYSTIERWFYIAKDAQDPIEALRRTVRRDAGWFKAISDRLAGEIKQQYLQYPHFTVKLHHANLTVVAEKDPLLGKLPSYPSFVRYMRAKGFMRTKRTGNEKRPGIAYSRTVLDRVEMRSFEVEYVGGLWHLDFHTSRYVGVLAQGGRWVKPILLAILDDRSRLCCHAQFYLEESTENLVHGFCQALLKRGLPRSLLSDNGGEMTAAEFVEGLERLSILHETTLPYTPAQNGKQEHLWAVVEGRFLSMLDGVADLTLDRLNTALLAWIEGDYHRSVHGETKQTPVERFLQGPDVLRPAPDPLALKQAFRRHLFRRIRRSDATLSLDGIRFEIPYAYRHLDRVKVASARWDLSFVHLVDPRFGKTLARIFPLDKSKNASGERRAIDPRTPLSVPAPPSDDFPPLLKRLVEEYAASGLPPAYLPKNERNESNDQGRCSESENLKTENHP
jgi:transposase InsO family protein